MRDKRELPISANSPLVKSTHKEGGNRSSSPGGTQPPSMGTEPGAVDIPVGSLIQYTGTERRITFDDKDSDLAIVLDRDGFHRNLIMGYQANPDVWPYLIPMLYIQWLQEPGFFADDRWKPSMWKEEEGTMGCKRGWVSGRGPGWVLENNINGVITWRVIE
jgi:hypothetical protein